MFYRSKGVISLAALISVGSLLLAGCSLDPSTSGDETGQAADDANATIAIDLPNYPSTLDPGLQYDGATYPVYRNIYDQLLRRDSETLEPVPWIATEWELTSPTTWTFTLRDDVKFSDGSPLTAEDAAFSLNRILDKSLNSPQFANFNAVKEAHADGDTTLVVETKEPSATLLSYLTTLSIVSKAYVDEVGAEGLNEEPMGSGAYTLESAKAGSQVTLVRNDDYWNGAPDIAEVVFRAVPNVATRVADLNSGLVQLAATLGPDQATQLKSNSNLQVLSTPTERVAYLGLNALGDTPTKNVKVRQAVAHAINYDLLITNLAGEYGEQVDAVLTPLAFGYPENVNGYTYDPELSRQLLDEAGMPNPEIDFPSSPSYNPQIIQAVQSDLQAVGFTVNIVNTDQATFLQKVQSPDHEWGSVRFGRWSCSCLDADGVIYPLFHTGSIWSSFSNPDFDAVVEAARTSTDEAERLADYDEAFKILDEEVPGIGLYQEYAIYGASKNLSWQPDAVESMYLDQMSLSGKS